MKKFITIHLSQAYGMPYDPRYPLPYPFHIDATTGDCIRGRGTHDLDPNIHPDRPWRLLGFQTHPVIQNLDVTLQEAREDFTRHALGKIPVFVDGKGSIFALTSEITHLTVTVRDDDPAI